MTNTFFHTYDIFNIEDVVTSQRYFDSCHKKALNSGLKCLCLTNDSFKVLVLWGTKHQFLKYYLSTIMAYECKWKGVIRFISFLFEKD